VLIIVGEACGPPAKFGGEMSQRDNGERKTTTIVKTLVLAAIGYVLAKTLPDIARYIKISRM